MLILTAFFLFCAVFNKNSQMLLNINSENPEGRKIATAVEKLKSGGVIIYPTDTIYGLGCDIFNKKAVEKICQLRKIKPEKANLSFICNDLSHLSEYAAQIDNSIFKLLKKTLPGPYTFILKSSNLVPKLFKNNKKTIGIRIPDNNIARALVEGLGRPILSISLKNDGQEDDYLVDPIDIYDSYKKLVDLVIDGGIGSYNPSTVVDCTSGEPDVIREGAGDIYQYI